MTLPNCCSFTTLTTLLVYPNVNVQAGVVQFIYCPDKSKKYIGLTTGHSNLGELIAAANDLQIFVWLQVLPLSLLVLMPPEDPVVGTQG